MEQFVISCCSTADMPIEFFRQRKIEYVCFHFTLDGKEYFDDLGQTVPFDEFYRRMKNGSMPTTSLVNTEEFVAFFEPLLQQGRDILHISLSSGLSGTYQSACLAQEELSQKYPERTIRIVDSLGASSGYGLLVDKAADLRDEGMSLLETEAWLLENRLRVHHWFFSTDLSHFKRGGRISAASAMVGTMLNICPLMNVDKEGHLVQRTKIRGKKKVIREIVQKMENHAENGLQYAGKCFLSHSACLEDAHSVADLIEEKFTHLDGKVMITSIGTVIGAHTGPGTVALFFWGDERVD